MKRLLLKAMLVLFAVGAYAASPFATAWFIREAVRDGNSAYLERAIDWQGVRETLKPQLSRLALNLPDPETAPAAKPGIWQRFKAYMGKGAVDRAVDGYITPEGLPQLFTARKLYRDYVAGQPEESKLPIIERMQRAWERVKRAEFTSLTSFEIDMADKQDENRIYLGKLELTGTGWMLKELRIRIENTAEATAQKQSYKGRGASQRAWSTGFISPAEAAPVASAKDDTYARQVATDRKVSFWIRALAAAHLNPRGDR